MFKSMNFEGFYRSSKGMLFVQKTLADAVACTGVGVHSGVRMSMTLKPAPENSGISFVRTDIFGKDNVIKALYSSVSDTRLCTCLGNSDGVSIGTVEHLMAAFHAAGVTNVTVEVSGPEIPILDGSASPFLFLVECAGIKEQNEPLKAVKVLKEVCVTREASSDHSDAIASLSPASFGLEIDFVLDYPGTMIKSQKYVYSHDLKTFKGNISHARTFGFLHEIEYLKKNGLAKGGSLKNAVIVEEGHRIINEEGLRYSDEFVRHKIVDAVGDLYTAGYPIIGKYKGIKSGHAMNNELLRELFKDPSNYEIVDMNEVLMGKNYQKEKVFM